MINYFTKEKDFEKIKKGDEIEIFVKNADKPINGKVIENNIQQSYILIDDKSTDAMIKYEQIKSVEIFEFVEFDILKYNKEREENGIPKIEMVSETPEQRKNLDDFCMQINHEGCLLSKLNEYEKAIQKYDLVLAVNPKYLEALYNKGRALHFLGEYDKAIELYDEVLKIEPGHIIALHNKGMDLFFLEKYIEAVKVFNSVLKMDPHHTDAINNKKVTLKKLIK